MAAEKQVYKYIENVDEFNGSTAIKVKDASGDAVWVARGETVELTDEQAEALKEHYVLHKSTTKQATADSQPPAQVQTNVAEATGPSVEGNDRRIKQQ